MLKEDIEKKIAELRVKYVDADSINWIDDAEKSFKQLIEEQSLKDNPVFIAITADAEKKLNEINALLQNDASLTDIQRASLFEAKKVWKFIFDRFGLVPHDNALESLNNLLDSKITQ